MRTFHWKEVGGYLLTAILLSGILYATPREHFGQLILLYIGAFGVFLYQVWPILFEQKSEEKASSIVYWMWAALGLRLIALFAIPALSDDYFRFVWDGRLLAQGINPFLELPSSYMENPDQAAAIGLTPYLFEQMNSQQYFTIYPSVLQAVFYVAAKLFPDQVYGAVWIMKVCIFLAEAGSLVLIVRLLRHWDMASDRAVLYALNPFIIVELTGNLHFEAIMIFFLLLSIWLLVKGKWIYATIPFALAISSKLLPVMLLPLLLRRIGFWKTTFFSGITLVISALLFLPLYSPEALAHLLESVRLYYESFEFNASIYYVIRWLGYVFIGFNIIGVAGKCLAVAKVLGILLIVWREPQPSLRNLPRAMLWTFALYFSLASIVHPWYITTLLALGLFTHYRFPVLWTLLLPLSYFAYRTDAYEESLLLVGISYLLVYGAMLYEWRGFQLKQPA